VQKKQLKRDPETQLLEDVICLVFLEFYFDPFAEKYSEEKLIDIVQKTWRKMSERAHSEALKLSFSKPALALLSKALNL
jgi:5-methylthioribose kinase